jgi:hypothetical protein
MCSEMKKNCSTPYASSPKSAKGGLLVHRPPFCFSKIEFYFNNTPLSRPNSVSATFVLYLACIRR